MKQVLIAVLSSLFLNAAGQHCDPMFAESPTSNGPHLAALAVDDDIDTYWQGKYEMVDGQSFVFDLGDSCAVIAVLFDVGPDHCSGYPSIYALYASTDGNTWSRVGDTFRGGTVCVAEFPTVVARFFKIAVLRASAGRWAIADIRVE